jgi:hypothetical protein
MDRGIAEVGLARKRATMVEVHVVLPGEANAAVHLDRL